MINFVIDRKYNKLIDRTRITNIIEKAFIILEVESAPEFSIIITDDKKLQSLNKSYRGIDETTDVLSFYNEYLDLETGVKYLGDIFISYPRADEQAKIGGHQTEQEVELLIVHGLLHLEGYDHDEKSAKIEMWKLQSQILESSGNMVVIKGDSE
jgi:probable rRNA maturation factor